LLRSNRRQASRHSPRETRGGTYGVATGVGWPGAVGEMVVVVATAEFVLSGS
jgi:hypothetical protein